MSCQTECSKLVQLLVQDLSVEERNRHRAAFLHFCQSSVGSKAEIVLSSQEAYAGTFLACTPFCDKQYEIGVKDANPIFKNRGDVARTNEGSSSRVIPMEEVLTVRVEGVHLRAKGYTAAGELMTDSNIQQRDLQHLEGRDLQMATAWLSNDNATTFEELSVGHYQNGKWDQFLANEKLFNVKSTFDENVYTSKLDLTKMSRDQIKYAERIAREIESGSSDNIHLLEERGQLPQSEDYDEEDRFSGVLRSPETEGTGRQSPSVYIPPHQRSQGQVRTHSNLANRNSHGRGGAASGYERPSQSIKPTVTIKGREKDVATPPTRSSHGSSNSSKELRATLGIGSGSNAATSANGESGIIHHDNPPGFTLADLDDPTDASALSSQLHYQSQSQQQLSRDDYDSELQFTFTSDTPLPTLTPPPAIAAAVTQPGATPSQSDSPSTESQTANNSAQSTASASAEKKTLNPLAKEFKFNVAAAEWKPPTIQATPTMPTSPVTMPMSVLMPMANPTTPATPMNNPHIQGYQQYPRVSPPLQRSPGGRRPRFEQNRGSGAMLAYSPGYQAPYNQAIPAPLSLPPGTPHSQTVNNQLVGANSSVSGSQGVVDVPSTSAVGSAGGNMSSRDGEAGPGPVPGPSSSTSDRPSDSVQGPSPIQNQPQMISTGPQGVPVTGLGPGPGGSQYALPMQGMPMSPMSPIQGMTPSGQGPPSGIPVPMMIPQQLQSQQPGQPYIMMQQGMQPQFMMYQPVPGQPPQYFPMYGQPPMVMQPGQPHQFMYQQPHMMMQPGQQGMPPQYMTPQGMMMQQPPMMMSPHQQHQHGMGPRGSGTPSSPDRQGRDRVNSYGGDGGNRDRSGSYGGGENRRTNSNRGGQYSDRDRRNRDHYIPNSPGGGGGDGQQRRQQGPGSGFYRDLPRNSPIHTVGTAPMGDQGQWPVQGEPLGQPQTEELDSGPGPGLGPTPEGEGGGEVDGIQVPIQGRPDSYVDGPSSQNLISSQSAGPAPVSGGPTSIATSEE